MITLISAISLDRVIGVCFDKKMEKGRLPWNSYEAKGDLRRFKLVTQGGVVIMGDVVSPPGPFVIKLYSPEGLLPVSELR